MTPYLKLCHARLGPRVEYHPEHDLEDGVDQRHTSRGYEVAVVPALGKGSRPQQEIRPHLDQADQEKVVPGAFEEQEVKQQDLDSVLVACRRRKKNINGEK